MDHKTLLKMVFALQDTFQYELAHGEELEGMSQSKINVIRLILDKMKQELIKGE